MEPTQTIFEHVLARPVDRPGGADPALVHLSWTALNQGERLVQVYVNEVLHDVTLAPDQDALWLVLDRRRAHRIELLAIDVTDPNGPWQPRPAYLKSWQPQVNDTLALSILRDPALPVDTRMTVKVDGEMSDTGALWPADTSRGGFGAVFGEGSFGIDAVTGPGLGQGELGHGPLGSDGTAWHWHRDDMPAGSHAVEVQATDAADKTIAVPLTRQFTNDDLPAPPQNLHMSDTFTLKWD